MEKKVSLQLFTKAPIVGKVKTRLISELGEKGAQQLHINMLRFLLSRIKKNVFLYRELWIDLDVNDLFLMQLADQYEFERFAQVGETLGDKMFYAIQQGLTRADYVIVIGSDCVSIEMDYISSAIQGLNAGNDLVLGPAADGGYVLLAVARADSCLFNDIAWGTSKVLNETIRRIKECGFNVALLPERWDVDDVDDLNRLEHVDWWPYKPLGSKCSKSDSG